jgi:hypothetical protein
MLRKAAPLLLSLLLIAVYYWLFSRFFPNASGRLGHDYALFLPYLLDGYFWYTTNGVDAVPWFTPSFCGGLPRFANQYLYYSVPQFLSFVTDPLSAIRFTLVIFAALGFSGFYAVLRGAFRSSVAAALFGATLFLFNGFFAHRMIVGHLSFHGFMLTPWIAFFLFRPIPSTSSSTGASRWRLAFDVVMAAVLTAYIAVSSVAHLPLPMAMTLLVIGSTLVLTDPPTGWLRVATVKAGSALVLATALSAAKLAAAAALVQHFPRDFYPLPGFASALELVRVLGVSLFWTPAGLPARGLLANTPWDMGRHEFEYGVTVIPLLILLTGMIGSIGSVGSTVRRLRPVEWAALIVASLLLLVPLALNLYTPAWNAILKRIPFIKNSSQNLRFFSVYIPVVILFSALILDRSRLLSRLRGPIVAASIVGVVAINVSSNRAHYHREQYDPSPVLRTYARTRAGDWSPEISAIAATVDRSGRPLLRFDRNNAVTAGYSQLFCYETVFGYRLERFPRKTLRPGSPLDARDGHLNLKNPACYVFPAENACEPGDHFTVDQQREAVAFLRFRPFSFEMSGTQRLANRISGGAAAATLLALLVLPVLARTRSHGSAKNANPGPAG